MAKSKRPLSRKSSVPALAGAGNADLRRQVGQLLIMGFDGHTVSEKLHSTIATLQPGGIILFARNINAPRQTWQMLRDCQAASLHPLFLCVDMEGGTVDRLKSVAAPVPSAASVFSGGNAKLYRMHGHVIGLAVRAMGFNTDFAPVFDLGFEASRPVLTTRTVSDDPRKVTLYAREFLRGLKSTQVLGCGKHFPGLGEAKLDSHHHLPVIRKPWKKMWAEDLAPYRELHRQIPFVMVAHACYPEVTKDKLPASLSSHWMKDVLRGKIGYKGLIISDDLEMGGALAAGSIEDVSVETLRAGADMFLICHNQELVWRSYEAVLREAEKNPAFAAHVKNAAARVERFKQRAPELHRFPAPPSARPLKTIRKLIQNFSQVVEPEEEYQ
jgi:beta-N-acetylhexosaminidase